jgi:hypothetical protein
VNFVILASWWIGTLLCLVNGIFAFVAPTRWMTSSWGRPHMPALSNPKLVRALGGVFAVLGVYWAVQAVRMTQELLH